MEGTYCQIYMHIVFGTRYRQNTITSQIEDEVYKYITGIVQNKGQKMLEINGMPDHIHFAIGMKPTCVLSDLVREIKKSSTEFIRGIQKNSNFRWQGGFAAFSASHRSLDRLIMYIRHQKEHHKKIGFEDEYVSLLKEYDLDSQIYKGRA